LQASSLVFVQEREEEKVNLSLFQSMHMTYA
jgi:hypothetical protein